MDTDRRILSVAAFMLLVVGILAPFVPELLGGTYNGSVIAFALLSLLLSLIFGILSRRFLLGRVAAVMATVAIIAPAVNYYQFHQRREATRREMVRETVESPQQMQERQKRDTERK